MVGTTSSRHPAIPLALLASACALLGASPAAATQSQRVASSASEVRDYWTAARMRAATPVDAIPASGAREGGSRAVVECVLKPCAEEIADPAAAEHSAHGKVFFTIARGASPGDYVCSGTVVNSRNRSVVWTAGHCVFDQDDDENEATRPEPGFVANWTFVPAYRDGVQPYGEWPAKRLATTEAWEGDGNIKYDLGAAVVRRAPRSRALQGVVGARAIAFNQPREREYRAYGYPAVPFPRPEFTGEREYRCTSPRTGDDEPGAPGPSTMAIRCDMSAGSSGGGWISNGTLLSVTSYGYPSELDRLYGPYMSEAARALYRSVRGKAKRKGGKGPKRPRG